MNFTTDLPKRNPLVSYIVASAVRCEKFFPGQTKNGPVYRMHAVILKVDPKANMQKLQSIQNSLDKKGGAEGQHNPQDDISQSLTTASGKQLYICCHVRRVEIGNEDNENSKTISEGKSQTVQNIGINPIKMMSSQDTMHNISMGKSMQFPSPAKQPSLHGQFTLKKNSTFNQQLTSHDPILMDKSHSSSSLNAAQIILDSANMIAGSKRPRRAAALKQREDSSDPYIYNLGKSNIRNRRTQKE